MPNDLADRLVLEAEELNALCQNIERSAFESNRDLNSDDEQTLSRSNERLDKINAQLAIIEGNRATSEQVRGRLAMLGPSMSGGADVKYRTAGELYWDFLAANSAQATPEQREGARRYNRVLSRAAEHMGTSAAATTPTAGGFGGLWVAGPTGPVIDVGRKGRPFLSMIGMTPAPNAMSFTRPRISDPNLLTGGAAVQTLQKAELVSKKFDLLTDTLTLSTVGGYLNLSQQAISFIPSALDMVINQLSRRVAIQTELAAITEMALTASHVDLAAAAAADVVLVALYDAAVLVYQTTGDMPEWLVAGPEGWAMLGSLVDAADRPLFPWLGPANALGTGSLTDMSLGPLGLQFAVTPAIADTVMYMGNSQGFEAYVYRFPVLEAVEPSLLGRQVAVAEAVEFYRPITTETGPAGNGVVEIGPAA